MFETYPTRIKGLRSCDFDQQNVAHKLSKSFFVKIIKKNYCFSLKALLVRTFFKSCQTRQLLGMRSFVWDKTKKNKEVQPGRRSVRIKCLLKTTSYQTEKAALKQLALLMWFYWQRRINQIEPALIFCDARRIRESLKWQQQQPDGRCAVWQLVRSPYRRSHGRRSYGDQIVCSCPDGFGRNYQSLNNRFRKTSKQVCGVRWSEQVKGN